MQPRQFPLRRIVTATLVGVGLLALTGCLDATYVTELRSDGSGTVVVDVAFSEQLIEVFETISGEELSEDELLEQIEGFAATPGGDDVRVGPSEDGVGLRVEIDVDDPTELGAVLGSFTADGTPPLLTEVQVDVGEDRATFSGRVTESSVFEEGTADFRALAGELPLPNATFELAMPGDITDSNADDVDGNVARWDLVANAGGPLTAESGISSGLLEGLAVPALGAVAAIALLGALVAIVRSRRAAATGTATPVAVGGWGGPSAASPASGAVSAPPVPFLAPMGPTGAASPPAPSPIPPAAPLAPSPIPPTAPIPPAAPPSAGWYPDPGGAAARRWWDGTRWTEHLDGGPP